MVGIASVLRPSWVVGTSHRRSELVAWARCWVLREQPALGVLLHDGPGRSVEPLTSWWVGAGARPGDRSLFENCTVDASIF